MTQELEEQKAARGVDEYWAVVRRRKWWIIGPLFIGWLLVFVSAWIIPAQYTSESVILIDKQKVPDIFVRPNVTVEMGERLESITQQVLSRQRLLGIINRFHLYQSVLTPTPDDQMKKMRADIKIDLVQTPTPDQYGKRELTAFKLQYTADNASVAQQVNSSMVSYFIDENVKASQQASESTTQFLDMQLRNAAESLAQQENRLRDFEKAHAGELPDQVQANIQMLTGAQSQLNSLIESRNRAVQQQTYLTSLLAQYEAAGADNMSSGTPQSIDQQIESARSALADMEARYTPDYPDVKKMKETIKQLQALKERQAGNGPPDKADTADNSDKTKVAGTATAAGSTPAPPGGDSGNTAATDKNPPSDDNAANNSDLGEAHSGTTPGQLAAMAPVMQLQSELKSNKMEIQNREGQIRALEGKLQELQAHLGGTSAVQAEMLNLTRDYTTTQKAYTDLLDKKNASALATNLQRQQQGENFRIIDPPSLPEKASFPDRFRFSLAGLAVGLGLAVLFGAGSEYIDDRIRSEQDLAEATPLPILVEIPPIRTDHEIASARRKPLIALAAAILVMIIIPTGIFYAYFWG
jgi:succinoglycan biosynthesis transport protein ExoP